MTICRIAEGVRHTYRAPGMHLLKHQPFLPSCNIVQSRCFCRHPAFSHATPSLQFQLAAAFSIPLLSVAPLITSRQLKKNVRHFGGGFFRRELLISFALQIPGLRRITFNLKASYLTQFLNLEVIKFLFWTEVITHHWFLQRVSNTIFQGNITSVFPNQSH